MVASLVASWVASLVASCGPGFSFAKTAGWCALRLLKEVKSSVCHSSAGESMCSPAARRARRSEIVWLTSASVMSTLVDCIWGVWNLRSFSSASTRLAGSRRRMSMS